MSLVADIIIEHLELNEETGEAVWTPYKYSFSPDEDFQIDPDNLDAEICNVGPLLNKYGDIHSRLQAQAERHKRDLETVSSEVYLRVKTKLLAAGDKATEATVKAEVTISPEYRDAVARYVETQRYAVRADGWWKSILKKSDLVQALAYKIGSEIKRGAY
jgi:hypothetical protein